MVTCSKGHKMILRLAGQGKNKGTYFYGCIKFPACKETKSVQEASPEVVISAEMKKTLKARYNKIIEQINKIWQMEKEKLILRNKIENSQNEINVGLRANAALKRSQENLADAAYIPIARKNKEAIKKDIEEIQKKQLAELKEIEDNIVRI